jgi:hypothetical protein
MTPGVRQALVARQVLRMANTCDRACGLGESVALTSGSRGSRSSFDAGAVS